MSWRVAQRSAWLTACGSLAALAILAAFVLRSWSGGELVVPAVLAGVVLQLVALVAGRPIGSVVAVGLVVSGYALALGEAGGPERYGAVPAALAAWISLELAARSYELRAPREVERRLRIRRSADAATVAALTVAGGVLALVVAGAAPAGGVMLRALGLALVVAIAAGLVLLSSSRPSRRRGRRARA